MARWIVQICLSIILALTVCTGSVGWAQTIARMNVGVVGGTVPAGATGDSCTGGLLLSLHFENNDDVTQGTPAGCSAGDSTLTKTGVTFSNTQYQDGGYALYNGGTAAHDAALTVTSGNIISSAQGKITAYIYLTENFHSDSDSNIIYFRAGTDFIALYGTSAETGNDLHFRHKRDGEAEDVAVANCNLSTGQWYLVTANWNVSGVTHKLSVTANSVTAYDAEGSVSAFASDTGTLYLNRTYDSDGSAVYVDNIKIYSSGDL